MHRFIAPAKRFGERTPLGERPSSACMGRRQARGVTLVEMMVTVAVAAVLLAIAVPNFNSMINANRLTSTANALIGALNTARIAAVQRNTEVQFCSNSTASNATSASDVLGTACLTNAGEVVALSSPGATSTVVVQVAPSELGVSSIQINGDIQAIRYNALGQGLDPSTNAPFDSGTPQTSPIADVCSTSFSTNNHILIYMAAGSVITTTTGSGACP
jgi:type IV fimbrial biogenesis protein FimT